MEFDHLFICTSAKANEATLLTEFGLTEGAGNRHPGQGTANRRFFFENSFIELLYVVDHEELHSELTKPTQLHQRFQPASESVSPFGVCFRPTGNKTDAPLSGWSYKPVYLPDELDITVGESPVNEPMWFYLPFGSRPDSQSTDHRQPAVHRCGFKEITSIRISVPVPSPMSAPAVAANHVPGVEVCSGDSHLLEAGFDSQVNGKVKDFRPALPLVFRW